MSPHREPTIHYKRPEYSAAEVRALGAPAVLVRTEHRSHVIDLAAWLNDVQCRTGRTPLNGSLLASEQREYDKRLKSITELEQLRPPKLSAAEALRRLGSEN